MAAPVQAPNPNRRALIFLAVGGGVLLLFFLVTSVLGGGGDDDLGAPVTFPPGGGPRGTTPTLAPGAPPDETFEVFSSKNPFTPLVPTGGATTGGGTATTSPPGGGGTVTTSPPTGGGPTPTTPPGTGPGTTSPPGTAPPATLPPSNGTEPRRGQRVALVDVYESGGRRVANVRVNDTVYEGVGPGDEFAGSFRVVSLDEACGTFLYGDDRFRLCRGDEVLK